MAELRWYQEEAAEFFTDVTRGIYGDGPGTGKTIGSIEVLRRWAPDKALIIVPVLQGAGLAHWKQQIEQQTGKAPMVAKGPPSERRWVYDQWSKRKNGTICVVGYEAMLRDADHIMDVGPDAVVCDEAHRLVNRNAKTVKALRPIARYADKLLLVTATPMVNDADDLWSLFNLIDPQLYSSYWRWVHQHCETEVTDFGGKLRRKIELVKGLLPGADKEIEAQLSPLLIQRSLDEVLPDISEPVVEVLHVDITPAERKAYDELKRKYVTEVGGQQIIALNEVSKITRLRQITSDWSSVFGDVTAGSKVLAAAELVKGYVGEQVVVMCAFQATCDRLVEKLGDGAVAYHGSTERSPEILRAFIAGKHRVLVGTLQSLGESIDGLQLASHILVLVDRPWNPKGYDQAVGRLVRSGQEHKVLVVHVTAAGTNDARVAEALRDKRDVAEAIGLS